jgi:FAD/FMN-containing dehydrogenase
MTGVIVDATLRLQPLAPASATFEAHPVDSIDAALQLISRSVDQDFVYSWHDGSGRRSQFGRGLVFCGRWSDRPSPPSAPFRSMTAQSRGRVTIPFWNRWTAAAANAVFRQRSVGHGPQSISAFDAAFPFARQTLYHRLFGRPGLAEVQVLVPYSRVAAFAASLRGTIEHSDAVIVMLSMKPFRGRQTSLSLAGDGMLFALNLARTPSCAAFLEAFDDVVVAHGAQPNAAKDSRLPRAVAARTLPSYGTFRSTLQRLDPARLYQSELSQRLAL